MEIKIRRLDAGAIKKIDEMARRTGESRNEFVKRMIEKIALQDELVEAQSKYEQLVQFLTQIISENSAALQKVSERLEKMNEND